MKRFMNRYSVISRINIKKQNLRVNMIRFGEGNGTPLQCSCLENPTDGGAWWAAGHGVTKSRTWPSDVTFSFSLSCIGEGTGNPLQCSCLENPRDGGAWWADVYGVAQSRTRLTWLRSRSSMIRFLVREAVCSFVQTITSDMQMTPPLWQKVKRN